jgi:uncharacterized protein
MNCPVCTSPLQPVDRGGIEIDVCSRCRGVWLDRGELDKLIAAASSYYGGRRGGDDDSDFGGDDSDYGRRHAPPPPGYGAPPPGYGHPPPGHYPHKKKKGFFGNLFDFD